MRNNCIYSIECRFSSYFDTDGKHKRKESPGKKRNKPKMAPQFLLTPFRVSETHSAKRARIVDVVFLFFKKTLSFAAFDFIFLCPYILPLFHLIDVFPCWFGYVRSTRVSSWTGSRFIGYAAVCASVCVAGFLLLYWFTPYIVAFVPSLWVKPREPVCFAI